MEDMPLTVPPGRRRRDDIICHSIKAEYSPRVNHHPYLDKVRSRGGKNNDFLKVLENQIHIQCNKDLTDVCNFWDIGLDWTSSSDAKSNTSGVRSKSMVKGNPGPWRIQHH